jgi:hypothetical protein
MRSERPASRDSVVLDPDLRPLPVEQRAASAGPSMVRATPDGQARLDAAYAAPPQPPSPAVARAARRLIADLIAGAGGTLYSQVAAYLRSAADYYGITAREVSVATPAEVGAATSKGLKVAPGQMVIAVRGEGVLVVAVDPSELLRAVEVADGTTAVGMRSWADGLMAARGVVTAYPNDPAARRRILVREAMQVLVDATSGSDSAIYAAERGRTLLAELRAVTPPGDPTFTGELRALEALAQIAAGPQPG